MSSRVFLARQRTFTHGKLLQCTDFRYLLDICRSGEMLFYSLSDNVKRSLKIFGNILEEGFRLKVDGRDTPIFEEAGLLSNRCVMAHG